MVLLDTCAIIWMIDEQPMTKRALQAIRQAARQHSVLVSPISAWEVGLLATKNRHPFTFRPSPAAWFTNLLAKAGIRMVQLEPRAAIEAAFLPGNLQRDPADRLLIATARALDVPIVTRDERILAYAGQGHVQVIAC
jgi:PIN domain nuclease of toxin-antitoxin system